MTLIRRRLGWTLVIGSLLLHGLTVYAYARQPDRLAAFTVFPIWFWGTLGLLASAFAYLFLRASLSFILFGIWALTILAGADETKVLGNLTRETLRQGKPQPYSNLPVIRVATLNCAHFQYGNPALDLALWEPDIVFLQEVSPFDIKFIADTLYGGRGDYRYHQSNGIVTRWRIQREVRNPRYREQQVTLTDSRGREIELVNVHLASASTNLRFWQPTAWKEHQRNRVEQQQELSVSLQLLEQTSPFPARPTLLGGDFNSPANDPIHHLLARDFNDCFLASGKGWANTFQRRMPVVRIDYLYATRQFTPVRSRVVTTPNTDHRIVLTDLIFPEG